MPHIHDIEGVFCPMGCGQTLHLMAGNMICCLAPDCPDKGAAQKILSDPESEHIVVFGPDSFTVRHPLRERLGDLITCDMHTACTLLPGPPEGRTGQYRARLTESGLDLEPLDAKPGQPAQMT
jgi:hypothetical protein